MTAAEIIAHAIATGQATNYAERARVIRAQEKRARDAAPELLALLIEALPCIEESEEFNKPNAPRLSTRARALIRAIDPEAGA